MVGALSPGLARRKELSLTMTTVHSTNIAPKEAVTYAKQTQTNESGLAITTEFYSVVFWTIHDLRKRCVFYQPQSGMVLR